MDAPNYNKIYRLVPIFRTLDNDEVREIIQISRLYRVQRGCAVVREGIPGDGMYIIVQGTAQVQLRLHQGDRTRLAELGPGDVFGELSLLDNSPRSATVVMKEDGVLYKVESEGFARMRKELKPAAFKVIRELAPIMATRLRDVNRRLGEFFGNPERSMAMLEQRYLSGSRHAVSVDPE